jgi:3-deoxy-D-manno-octulosonate 8-phosphate phosphatase (KDO 8-P phosphatase)
MDVDGVLTDGTVWLDEGGREIKRVAFADIMGVSLGRRAGLVFALVSGESGPSLAEIAAKFGIEDVYAGCRDKAAALQDFAGKHDLSAAEVCFIGDDVNDLAAFELCGHSPAPSRSRERQRARATLVTDRKGGHGAVREVVDHLLAGAENQERPASQD